jgi:hypothetical protein
MWSFQPARIDLLGLIFKNYLNTWNLNFDNHWWILFLIFFVLTCESDSCILQFLNELNLTYWRLISFVASFYFIPNSVGSSGQVFIVSHSYQTYFDFSWSDLNLYCGLCNRMITRFVAVGIRARLRNKVISFYYFCFFSVSLSFSVFASFIFSFFVYASSKKKKGYILSCYCL